MIQARSILVIGLMLSASAIADDTPSVDQIVERANHAAYYQDRDGQANVHMVITDSQGRTRERRFTILRLDVQDADAKDNDGEQMFYVYFHRPADVNKMVFMVHKHMDRDDDRWLYLPSLDLVKRIAATDKRTSFVGSDFLYEDVSGRRITDDKHELVETTDTYYKLKSTPKDPDAVEFAHYITWIHRKTYLPISTEYYDEAGTKIRQYTAKKVETIGDHPTVVVSQMADLRTGSTTVLTYSDVEYGVGLPESVFTERYLRRAPQKWLQR
jgi:outer membrane lipoprotein-sorting protein